MTYWWRKTTLYRTLSCLKHGQSLKYFKDYIFIFIQFIILCLFTFCFQIILEILYYFFAKSMRTFMLILCLRYKYDNIYKNVYEEERG